MFHFIYLTPETGGLCVDPSECIFGTYKIYLVCNAAVNRKTCFCQKDERKMQAFLKSQCFVSMALRQEFNLSFQNNNFILMSRYGFKQEIRVQLPEREVFYFGFPQNHLFELFRGWWSSASDSKPLLWLKIW